NSRAEFVTPLQVGEKTVSDGLELWFGVACYRDRWVSRLSHLELLSEVFPLHYSHNASTRTGPPRPDPGAHSRHGRLRLGRPLPRPSRGAPKSCRTLPGCAPPR